MQKKEIKLAYHKFMESNSVKGHKIDLALLQDVMQIDMDSTQSMNLQTEVMAMHKALDKSMQIVKEGLKKAEIGLASAKELGDEKTVQSFTNWVNKFNKYIAKINAKTTAIDKIEIF